MASADCNEPILKLASARLGSWSIHVLVSWLTDSAWWKSCADHNGCRGLDCSEYLRCLLYYPVTLPYACPPAFSTPTTCLWACVFVGSGVQVRSGCWQSIGSLLGVSSGGDAPSTLAMSRSFTDSLLMAIQVHLVKSNNNGSEWSQSADGRIPLGNSFSFPILGDIVETEYPVGSGWIIVFWRYSIWHVSG